MNPRILTILLAALTLWGLALAQTTPVEDFEGAFPSTSDAFGNGIGFTTWQDGGGDLQLGTLAVAPDDALALPDQTDPTTVMAIEHTINQWGGFTHAFTDDAATTWVSRDWSGASALRFWYRGAGSGGQIQVDLFDNRSPDLTGDSAERFFYRFDDDTTEWREIEIPLSSFRRRTDFQPGGAPNDGLTLTEVWGYAFGFPPGEGVSYLDDVVLVGAAAGGGDDRTLVSFAAPSFELPEGGTATVTVALNRPSDEAVSVRLLLRGDTARDFRDIVSANELIVFRPGETEKTFEISALDDSKHEGDERATLILDGPIGADIGFQRRATVFVRDDDPLDPSLVDDFDRVEPGWQLGDGVDLNVRELASSAPGALPGQDLFESVLEIAAPDGGAATRAFAQGRDWSGAEAIRFWYRGRGDGAEVTVRLRDNRAPDAPWDVVWADEFDGPAGAPPDPASWTPEIGDGTANGIPGWGNAERQSYTGDAANVATDGEGNLVISALEVAEGSALSCYYGPCEYTSARLITSGKVEVTYGRIESRLRLPEGQGLWPAFWMLGNDLDTVGWPLSGEIDIMENIGREPGTVHGTIHGPDYSGANGIGAPFRLPEGERFADDFHTFAIDWAPGEIRWSVDGELYSTLTPDDLPPGAAWVYDHPFFLLLNVAVGGAWPGYPDVTTTFPQRMTIDYVRVLQAPDSAERWSSTFRDDTEGWVEITLPLADFVRAAEQPDGAPDDGLGLDEVWGVTLELPAGDGSVALDRLSRVGATD